MSFCVSAPLCVIIFLVWASRSAGSFDKADWVRCVFVPMFQKRFRFFSRRKVRNSVIVRRIFRRVWRNNNEENTIALFDDFRQIDAVMWLDVP